MARRPCAGPASSSPFRRSAPVSSQATLVLASWLAILPQFAARSAPGTNLLEIAGPRGIACVIECGDGKGAMELARKEGLVVLALDADAADVEAARANALREGVLGRGVYVARGGPDRIPFADHLVDRVAAASVSLSSLSAAQKEEVRRVLVPARGRAEFKDGTIEKPELPGSDWWTHKLRAPDNNFASRDTVFQWPPILQFQAMPMHNAYQGGALSAGGRNIEFGDWVVKDPWRAFLAGRIIARSTYNGAILWTGMLPKGVEPAMPILAAVEDTLFIAAGDRAAVTRRSLADGAEGEPVEIAGADQRVRWLAVEKGVLYALSGPAADLRAPFQFALQPGIQQAQHKNQTLHCRTFTAYDLAGKRALWTHSEPKANIDFRGAALSKGRLVFYVEKERLAALDAATGKEVWRNEGRDWIDAIQRPPRPHNWNNDFMGNLSAGEGLIRFTPFEARATILFREKDGETLLVEPHQGKLSHGGQKQPIAARGGKVFLGQGEIDPATGKGGEAKLPAPVGMAWCGIATYAPGIGMIGHASMGMKSPCGVGAWTAGGLLHFFPTVCDCGAIPGAVTFAGGGALFDRAKNAPEHPLGKGPAFGEPRAVAAHANDWAAYRSDALHRGSSAASLPARGAVAWTWRPEKPFAFSKHYSQHGFNFDERPVSPLIAGGRVFSAGSDGVVRAHQLADGGLLWTSAHGGPVFGSPAFLDGLLLVPSLDGHVYALDAATGGLAWQRRLAPLDRRIHVFGKLAATWPVLSLIAREGRVYAVAGYFRGNGAKAFCLDAPTGEIVWQRWCEPEVLAKGDVPLDSHGFGGQIALVQGNLWAAGLQSVPMVLDSKTGEPRLPDVDDKMQWFFRKGNDAVGAHLTSLGQDIVNLDDRAVLIGGGMLFENHNVRDAKNSRANFKLFPLDGKGGMLLDVARLSSRVLDTARLAPAYDDKGLVFVARYEKEGGDRKVQVGTAGLNFWDKDAFLDRGLKLQKQPAVVMPEGGKGAPKVEARDIFDPLPYAEGVWSKPEVLANAVALAANAVVSAEATKWSAPKGSWDKELLLARAPLMTVEGWQLAARDRKDGGVLWAVPLPEEPVFNGLAIAPDGTVVVALRDGSLVATQP